jgi:hypothetical protein
VVFLGLLLISLESVKSGLVSVYLEKELLGLQ